MRQGKQKVKDCKSLMHSFYVDRHIQYTTWIKLLYIHVIISIYPFIVFTSISADIMVNLERLVCGHLYLSTALTMFTNQQNVPQLADFVSATVEVSRVSNILQHLHVYVHVHVHVHVHFINFIY